MDLLFCRRVTFLRLPRRAGVVLFNPASFRYNKKHCEAFVPPAWIFSESEVSLMDLSTLFQLKTAWSGFQRRHPKFVPFCRAAKTRITEGTVLEITVTPPDGQPLSMNLKVAAQDLDALNQLMGLAGQASQP